MTFFTTLPSIPRIRPSFNVGALLDIPTGAYHIGKYGESILNGGMSPIVSIAGPGNSFKTVICLYLNMVVAEHIDQFQCSLYDSETSLTYERINILAQRFEKLSEIDHSDSTIPLEEARFIITSAAEMLGDEYFDRIKTIANTRKKDKKDLLTTPFLDSEGKPISILPPVASAIDSLSELKVSSNEEKIVDKFLIGDSGQNILYMKQGIAKKQLMTQMPLVANHGGIFFTLVAHVGDEFDLGMMTPKKHKLTHSKKGSKVTGATKAFEFINNAIYEIFSAALLNNAQFGTGVLYPVLESDRDKDCTDLLKVHMRLTRNKSGPSGASIDLVISQREGVLAHLSQFDYIKEHKQFGLVGNDRTYALSLYPDVKLSRTTVRGIIDENANVRRALEFTSELLQIRNLWPELPDDLWCTPDELYRDLIALGYDWSILLNTRGFWVFTESNVDNLPYLSTMDLLKIRKGLYHPYWLMIDDKTKYDDAHKHSLNT